MLSVLLSVVQRCFLIGLSVTDWDDATIVLWALMPDADSGSSCSEFGGVRTQAPKRPAAAKMGSTDLYMWFAQQCDLDMFAQTVSQTRRYQFWPVCITQSRHQCLLCL
jgi:hypothetical protein